MVNKNYAKYVNRIIDYKEIEEKLIKKNGYSKEKAREIIEDAKNSSNPVYILHYYGISGKYLDKYEEVNINSSLMCDIN